jgi:hypothetical protein
MSYLEKIEQFKRDKLAAGAPGKPVMGSIGLERIEFDERSPASRFMQHATLFDLPFPEGWAGLPRAQVEAAELIQDKMGINEPILRRFNVLSWVRTHLQYQSLNRGQLYEAIFTEQQRLWEILKKMKADDGR